MMTTTNRRPVREIQGRPARSLGGVRPGRRFPPPSGGEIGEVRAGGAGTAGARRRLRNRRRCGDRGAPWRQSVSGLDLSPVLLERARKNASIAGVDIDFVEGDAEALPYPDASFDVVLSQFGHIFAPRPAVAAARNAAGAQDRRARCIFDLAARIFHRPHVHIHRPLFAAATAGNRAGGAAGFVGRSRRHSRTAREVR